MNYDEFKVLVKGMKAVYTQPTFLPDRDAVNVWYKLLQDIDYNIANAAIQKYMLTQKFPPTIADIREMAATVSNGDKPLWSDGWEQVLNNLRKYGMCTYDPDRLIECMNSFDPLTRMAVERLGWKELCKSENIMADRANFRMIFEQLAERQQKNNQLPTGLTELIETIQNDRKGIEHESKRIPFTDSKA